MKSLKFKIKSIKEEKLIWNKFKSYIYLTILLSCLIVIFNININTNMDVSDDSEKSVMKYIFHDYDWNIYVLNDETHGTSVSLGYLINDDIPDSLKDDENEVWSVSLSGVNVSQENNLWNEVSIENDVKDNQVSVEEIIQELWVDWGSDSFVVDFDNVDDDNVDNQDLYKVTEEQSWNVMVITKQDDEFLKDDDKDVEVNSGDLDYFGQVFT